jgi:hypothetical protein
MRKIKIGDYVRFKKDVSHIYHTKRMKVIEKNKKIIE